MPVISEPVPAVVGTQTIGTLFSGSGLAARRKAGDRLLGAEQHGGELAGIERRAAAQAHDGPGAGRAAELPRRFDLRLLRLAGDLGVEADVVAGLGQRLRPRDRRCRTVSGPESATSRTADGRPASAVDLVAERGERTGAAHHAGAVVNSVKRHWIPKA